MKLLPMLPAPRNQLSESDFHADREMVKNARGGEPWAVEEFMRRARVVRGFLSAKNRQLGGMLGPEELEDVLQDTLVSLWRKLGEYEGRGSFDAWAYRFSYLELLSRMRKLKRLPRRLEEADVPTSDAPSLGKALEHEHLYRMLRALGSPSSDIIQLKHLEGLSFDEIGEQLGMSTNTAKTRYYRGIRQLREMHEPQSELNTRDEP